jgi:hypothetical protein
MSARLDEIEAMLRGGQRLTFDDAADLFELTAVGSAVMQFNRLTRANMLAKLRARFNNDEAVLTAAMRNYLALQGHGPECH